MAFYGVRLSVIVSNVPPSTPLTWPQNVTCGNVTVKVYRVLHPRSKTGEQFVLAWKTPTGRVRKTYSSADTALDEAALKAAQLNAGHVTASSMTDSDRAELQAAREITGATPLLAALREWRTAHDLTQAHIIPAAQAWSQRHAGARRILAGKAYKLYIRARQTAGVKTASGIERTFEPKRGPTVARSFAKVFDGRYLHELTTDELALWLGFHENPVTHNTHRRRLITFFRWCRRRGYLPRDTITNAECTDPAIDEDDSPVEIETAARLRTAFDLISTKAPQYLPALAFAILSGLRRYEVHGQDWADVNLERGFFRVTRAKPRTPARRMVPILPALAEWLRPHVQKSGPICTNLALDRVRDICRTAGLRLVKNGFRHTWISARVETTGDKGRTALEAGTSTRKIDTNYLELMDRAEAEEVLSIAPK